MVKLHLQNTSFWILFESVVTEEMEYILFILDLTASIGLRSKYCHCKNPFSFNAMKIEKIWRSFIDR